MSDNIFKSIKKFLKGYGNILLNGERKNQILAWFILVMIAFFIGSNIFNVVSPYAVKPVSASEFVTQLESKNVEKISICSEDGSVKGTFKTPSNGVTNFVTTVPNSSETFTKVYLESADTEYDFEKESKFVTFIMQMFLIVLQVGLIIFAFSLLFRNSDMMGDLPFFDKDDETKMEIPDNTFADVVGVPEAIEEVQEVVSFLKNPDMYIKAGAKFPRGILMQGPPGSGKTLLARCLAGEAGVPFIHASGSEFIEMYVGVGAKRVRSLFEKARENQPSILFIDEIDAVGGNRDTIVNTSSEHLQTINQLLTEMDGFKNTDSVIVIAATNRGESLDPALLRPGRFDRIVTVPNPSKEGRKEILQHYAQGRPFEGPVDFDKLASHTYGFSGAELESVMDQASILAARRVEDDDDIPSINEKDIDEAISRVISGPALKSKKLSDKEKEYTSYHEAGHAVVQYVLPGCDPVQKISIVSRNMPGVGVALGYVQSYSEEDSYVMTSEQMRDEIAALLAGRCAEQMFCHIETAGASNDLERASKLAYSMVDRFAMDVEGFDKSFRVMVRDEKTNFLKVGNERLNEIDAQVDFILNSQWEKCSKVISEHTNEIEKIVEVLKDQETIDADEICIIMGDDPTAEKEDETEQE